MITAHDHIAAVLLAGGKARRMGGGDKCLLELAGSPMLNWVIQRMETQVSTTVINANGDPERFSLFSHPVISDTIKDHPGPLAGILAGMHWTTKNAPQCSHIISVPTDAPFLPIDLVAKLQAAATGTPNEIILASSHNRTHPVIGLWPTALASDLEEAITIGVRKVMDWVENYPVVIVEFTDVKIGTREIDPFFNTNTPAHLQEARLLLEEMLAGTGTK